MNEQAQTVAVTTISLIVANWAVVAPLIKWAIVKSWEKTIQWQQTMTTIDAMKADIEKLKQDVTAAHTKIRNLTVHKG